MLALNPGERLLILRRRRKLTQKQEAERRGVSYYTYRDMENHDGGKDLAFSVPKVDNVTRNELCLIHRRRAGLSLDQTAEKSGLSKFWISRVEGGHGSSERLFKFWEEYAG